MNWNAADRAWPFVGHHDTEDSENVVSRGPHWTTPT